VSFVQNRRRKGCALVWAQMISHIVVYRYLVVYPITGLDRPLGLQEVEAHRFLNNRHMKVVKLSALRTGRLYPPGKIPGTHFCQRLSRPQGHSATETIMSMKNSSDIIGNRTRDVPVCSAVPQPTAPPRFLSWYLTKFWRQRTPDTTSQNTLPSGFFICRVQIQMDVGRKVSKRV
jgi:hypothetical protein